MKIAFFVIITLLAFLAACATTPTATPTPNCVPDRVRVDPALGRFTFEWNPWNGDLRIYEVGRSTYKLKIEKGQLIVHLDSASGEKDVPMAEFSLKENGILLVPMGSRNADQSITIQYFAVALKCGKVYFDDHATRTN